MSVSAITPVKEPSTNWLFSAKSIITTATQTALRIGLPVLLFAGIGLVGDNKAHDHIPLLTGLGTLIGFGIALVLVRQQIKQINKATR